jgi:hypothetical protein
LKLSDFGLLDHVKTSPASSVFNDVDEFFEAIIEFLNEIQPPELQFMFYHWIEGVKCVLASNGN